MKITHLDEARAAIRQAHADKVRKLFEDHPEVSQEAIIVWRAGGVTLAPEDMSPLQIVGDLEAAKFGVLYAAAGAVELE